MCGILITSNEQVRADLHKRAARTMRHRGTSGNSYGSKTWTVTHIRLPINGLSDQYQQPFILNDTLAVMVGEYYDFDKQNENDAVELIARLISNPHIYLPGMYHAALAQDNRVQIFMDQLCKKPLYYRTDIPAIASEIKALTALGDVVWDKMYEGIVMNGELPPSSRTPYGNIRKFRSNMIMSDTGELTPMVIPQLPTVVQDLEPLLRQAIEKRFRADIPIGMLLSGGLDSSLLYVMAREMGYDPYVLHVDNQEDEYLKYLDINPERLIPVKIPRQYDLKKVLYYNETYLDRGSMVPQYFLGQAMKKGDIRVVITGDGADELFSGYKRAQEKDTWMYDVQELMAWHLPRLDKMMMAGTVEVRSPYLDDGIFRHQQHVSWGTRRGKQQLKDLAAKVGVPDEIIQREKQPLRFKPYAEDRESWLRAVRMTFKIHYAKGLD